MLRDGVDTQSGAASFFVETDEGDKFQAMLKSSSNGTTVDPDTLSLMIERISYQIPTTP